MSIVAKTAQWIKVSLGMEVGLCPGHIVLDGDQAPPAQKRGRAPQFSANGWAHQDATWFGGRPQPR